MRKIPGGHLESTVEMQIADETVETEETDETVESAETAKATNTAETEALSETQTQSVEIKEEISDETDAESTEESENIEDVKDGETEETEETTETEERETSESDADVFADVFGKTFENGTWSIVGDTLFIGVQNKSSTNSGFQTKAPWRSYSNSIKKAEVGGEGLVNASYMFYGLTELETIDLSEFKTDELIDTSHMFDGCMKLKKIIKEENLSGSKVKNISYMFRDCRALSKMHLTLFDTSGVENMSNMFTGCILLDEVILNENMSNVKDMSGMFSG